MTCLIASAGNYRNKTRSFDIPAAAAAFEISPAFMAFEKITRPAL
jgi:hypothetical protein